MESYKEVRLECESKVEVIEFTSKKGNSMCKIVVTQTFNNEGVEDFFTVESAHYKSNELLSSQFKFKNEYIFDVFTGLTAIESLKKVEREYKEKNAYLQAFVAVNLNVITIANQGLFDHFNDNTRD